MSEWSTNNRGRTATNSLDVSSLVDLKAVLSKKNEESKLKRVGYEETASIRPLKCKGDILKKKEKNSPAQKQNCTVDNEDEEELALKKSRLALESKTKLYEKLSQKRDKDVDDEENYLVDFHRKSLDNHARKQPNSGEISEKAEIMHKDNFEHIYAPMTAAIDRTIPVASDRTIPVASDRTIPVAGDRIIPDVNVDSEFTHYQNVQFNEVRDHGVGYFAFSQEENKRREEMDLLNDMHSQTKKKRLRHEEILKAKKASLESRLAKICERRNIDKSVISNYTKEIEPIEPSVGESACDSNHNEVELNAIPLPEDKIDVKPKVRPWDIGKDSISAIQSNVKRNPDTQGTWIDRKRSERLEEFAPPQLYNWP